LDIPVLAEGIETELQFELLKAEQCDEAQGYMLGRPKSAEELRREPALQAG
jgi:EAL domain-containing protein (putative c-di-GMP-specific phosphodiesterase class I)